MKKIIAVDELRVKTIKDIGSFSIHFNLNFIPESNDSIYTLSYVPEDLNCKKTKIVSSSNYRVLIALAKATSKFLTDSSIEIDLNDRIKNLQLQDFITLFLDSNNWKSKTDWRYK